MKKIIHSLAIFLLLNQVVTAQLQKNLFYEGSAPAKIVYGIRAGLNSSSITNSNRLGAKNLIGPVAGIFADMSYGKSYGIRDEINYVSNGFKFKNISYQGTVRLQYLYLTHLFTFNLGKIIQLQAGPELGILTKAKAATSRITSDPTAYLFVQRSTPTIMSQTTPVTYGICAGLEIYPYKGLVAGIRYHLGMSNINRNNKTDGFNDTRSPYFNSNNTDNFRNAMWEVVLGFRLINKNTD